MLATWLTGWLYQEQHWQSQWLSAHALLASIMIAPSWMTWLLLFLALLGALLGVKSMLLSLQLSRSELEVIFNASNPLCIRQWNNGDNLQFTAVITNRHPHKTFQRCRGEVVSVHHSYKGKSYEFTPQARLIWQTAPRDETAIDLATGQTQRLNILQIGKDALPALIFSNPADYTNPFEHCPSKYKIRVGIYSDGTQVQLADFIFDWKGSIDSSALALLSVYMPE